MSQDKGNDLVRGGPGTPQSLSNPPKSPPQASTDLPSIHNYDINGLDCPACGHPTLMLMSGGYITCALSECPNPDYAEAAQAHLDDAVLAGKITTLQNVLDTWEDSLTYIKIKGLTAKLKRQQKGK